MKVEYKIEVLYGFKELKQIKYTLKRIKVKRTWLNWYPKDQGILENDFVSLTGEFDDIADSALRAGIRFTVIEPMEE